MNSSLRGGGNMGRGFICGREATDRWEKKGDAEDLARGCRWSDFGKAER